MRELVVKFGTYVLLILLLGSGHSVFSQDTLTKENPLQPVTAIVLPLYTPTITLPKRIYSDKQMHNLFIENPAVRYSVDVLKKTSAKDLKDKELQRAIAVLLEYVENDRIQQMSDSIRNYTQTNAKRYHALDILATKVLADTAADEETLSPISIDMRNLYDYLMADTTFAWLKKIAQDSVLLSVYDAANQYISLWINNDTSRYYRFWPKNRNLDSVGGWIQAMPGGNKVRILMDDDVYQAERTALTIVDDALTPIKEPTNLKNVNKGNLRRRYWHYYGTFDLSFGQGYLENWAAGGENTLSFLSNLRGFLNYQKGSMTWENYLYYKLGFLRNGNKDDMHKNEDLLEINSKWGYKAYKALSYATQFNIQTMLFNGYQYNGEERTLIGNFLSPMNANLSVGMDFKPWANFSLYVSPIGGKWTYVRDTLLFSQTRYGVKTGEKWKTDAGARIELKHTIKGWNFLEVTDNFVFFHSWDKFSKQDVFIDWKLQFDFKISYFLKTTIYTNLILDKNFSDEIQFKETLNVGLSLRF
ncbi:hypothetical protein FACS1894199_11320 [Bacteroidia bacterium]|nr:hypothetical protein FACS1894199_11320 [Bacteroidia bacterium]